jgi:outer membrane protein OmpA-like peptidoglycan-associated protein
MQRLISLSLGGAVGAICATAYADAAYADNAAPSDAPSVYVAPMIQYSLKDNDPEIKDNYGYQVGIGVNLPKSWALEGDFSRGDFDIKGTDGARRLDAYTIDVIKKFFPTDIMEKVFINPYVLAGGGELNDRTDFPGFGHSTYHTFTGEAGIGFLTGLGRQDGSTRVQLRTEAKYRLEFASADTFGVKDPSGVVFGLGVQMNFGAPDDRPPKIVTHETVREVVREVQVQPPPPPPPPLPPPPKGDIRLQGVTFAKDSADLVPQAETVLDTTIASLKPYPNLIIEVRGYADSTGSQAYNLRLTQHRAETVMHYMQAHGLSNQITAKGFGKEDPIGDNATREGRLANRRVELHITGGDRGGGS